MNCPHPGRWVQSLEKSSFPSRSLITRSLTSSPSLATLHSHAGCLLWCGGLVVVTFYLTLIIYYCISSLGGMWCPVIVVVPLMLGTVATQMSFLTTSVTLNFA